MTGARLRIGLVAPPWLPVPPPGYGGTETVLDTLAVGLQEAGHEVVLFTTGDSTCPVPRSFVFERAPGVDVGGPPVEVHHVIAAYEALRGLDVIHDHTAVGPLYAASHPSIPVVVTNHNRFAAPFDSVFRAVGPAVSVVAISADHAARATDIPIAAMIHHGVDARRFPVGDGNGGFALFLGRMAPDKGAHRAIRIARDAGVRLVLAGKMHADAEVEYFEQYVRPYLGDAAEYVGEVSVERKLELLGQASCLLNPIAWDEPFGMVMVEAFACGTPVLAFAAGSAPEIVTDGLTGFLGDDDADLTAAVSRVAELDRTACRAAVEGYFSATRMVADHVALFEGLLGRPRSGGTSSG